jgi:hypothetical protein
MWEDNEEEGSKEGNNDFAQGDDEDELALDTFRHIIVR